MISVLLMELPPPLRSEMKIVSFPIRGMPTKNNKTMTTIVRTVKITVFRKFLLSSTDANLE